MSEDDRSREEQILAAVRTVLVNVAKETATEHGRKHPLTDNPPHGIRDCLQLISQRERELAEAAGRPSTAKPRFKDEPPDEVVVQLHPRKD